MGLFSVLPIFDHFIQFFGKFYAQITRTNPLNLWIFFDFKNYQPFLKYHARKVKIRRFTCIKIGNERFAAENCDYFFILNVFETKNISLNSIRSAESDEFKTFREIFQKPGENWENSRSVLSAPEISLDALIRIESESKYAILIG